MKDFLSMKIIALAITFAIAPLTYLVVRHIKHFWLWLNRQNATIQRAFVLVVAFGLTALAQVAGVTLPGECADVGQGLVTDQCQSAVADPVFVKAVLSALMAYLLHALKKQKPTD